MKPNPSVVNELFNFCQKEKRVCSSSTSSGSSTPNHHFNPPSITITDVAIEHHDNDSDIEIKQPVRSPKKNRASVNSMTSELMVPVQTIRRLSEPSTTSSEDGKRSPSPGSRSCGSPIVKKTLETKKGRKYSLEMPVPKIEINTDKIASDANVTPNPCIKYLSPMTIINASSDRTISESNLSTSGYSSLSSPGISRYTIKPIYLEHEDNWFLKLVLCNFNEHIFKNHLSTCSR
jgi:hypothetical protein